MGGGTVKMCILNRFAGRSATRRLFLILVLYVSVALAYGLVTPVYEGPDELGHVLYVKHIAEGRGIPVQSREYAIAYGFGQEGSQAPLYYALNAALVRVLGLSVDDLEGVPEINPFTTCGRPRWRDNVAFYRHDPRLETFPYQGAARAVHVMRLLSVLLGGMTVAAVYAATRLAFPGCEQAALLAAVLVAFNPQFAFMGGVVNNDNLVNCLTAAAVALTLYCLRRGFTWKRALVLGLVCGLAPLAKLGGLMALAFAGMGLLARGVSQGAGRKLRAADRRRHWLSVIGQGALILGVFLAVAGWWFVRNWVLYGDPTGMNMMLSVYGGRGGWPAHLVIPEILDTFRSYWAAFSCWLTFPAPIHWLFALLVGAGVVGLARTWRSIPAPDRRVVWLLLAWLGLVVVAWVRWNQITYAALGRLLFQANAAIGALLGYGLARLTARPRWMVTGIGSGLWALALAGALLVVRPAFALPARYPASDSPPPPQPLPHAAFGDIVTVVGYEVSPRSLEPGQALDVALYLRAARPITGDYALALQLLSPVPGDNTTLLNLNTIPGSGNYPTYAWLPGEVIVDRYRLRIPEQVQRVQAWRVVAILYRLPDRERLPATVDGQPADEMLGLGLVRLGASESAEVPLEAWLDSAPLFGEVIRLEGVWLRPEGESLRVQAWWRAVGTPPDDCTTLVHLYDEQGALLATGDASPLQGAFPTSLWKPGDLIADEYVLPRDQRGVRVGLGWYNPDTGVRLPAVGAGERLSDDVYGVALAP